MRWLNALRAVTAFLCQLYLTVVGSFIIWALLPLILGWMPTIVSSGSMEPRIQVGDIIFADPMDAPEIKESVMLKNVLLARDPDKPGALITHRVTDIFNEGEAFVTKGDANASNDSTPVPIENVLGIEKYRVSYIGIPVLALQKGDLITPGIFVVSLILSQLLVRKQWKIESGKTGEEAEQAKDEEIRVSDDLTSTDSLNQSRKFSKAVIGIRISSVIAVPAFILISSLTMSSSAAGWRSQTITQVTTFQACDIFRVTGNQTYLGLHCGDPGLGYVNTDSK